MDWGVLGIFIVLAVVLVIGYSLWPSSASTPQCPSRLHRNADGSLTLHPFGREFADMTEFQQWYHSSGLDIQCPLPVLTGKREIDILSGNGGWPNEQTYARTPIYKVDDYEFSRIFGFEKGGRMIVPRQGFNTLIEDRQFDWTSKPLSSDERRGKYAGLHEGFTAEGELQSSIISAAHDYDPAMRELQKEAYSSWAERDEAETPSAKERKAIQTLAEKAYGNDPAFDPVVTRVGPNQWEVTELRPRRQKSETPDFAEDQRIATQENTAVDLSFAFREKQDINAALQTGSLPWDNSEWVKPRAPLERSYGPTFDHDSWDFLPGPPL